jgi:hypothetical protein
MAFLHGFGRADAVLRFGPAAGAPQIEARMSTPANHAACQMRYYPRNISLGMAIAPGTTSPLAPNPAVTLPV